MDQNYKELPQEVHHPTDRAHMLKLVKSTGAAAAFICDGCKEPGNGPRYTGGSKTRTICLHTSCARADAGTRLRHHLFDGREFRFLEKPTPVDDDDERTICDACGKPARGFVYHSSASNREHELDLHPCCASLQPTITTKGGQTFELCQGASRSCALCGKNGRRRKFWAYRWRNADDGNKHVYLHVACVREAASRAWEEDYHTRVGNGGGVVQASAPAIKAVVRQSLSRNARSGNGMDNMINVVSTVARVIIAVIFGNPFAMIDALLGPSGFLR